MLLIHYMFQENPSDKDIQDITGPVYVVSSPSAKVEVEVCSGKQNE